MILTKAQVSALTKAQGAAHEALPIVEWLEQVAAVYPAIAERVQQLRDRRDMLARVAEVALEADRMMSQHG